ncbi:MAG: hypothetical protein ACREO3_00170 [Arenimonas sp.]
MSSNRWLVLLVCLCVPALGTGKEKSRAATPELADFAGSLDYAPDDDTLENRLMHWAADGATMAQLEANTVRDYGVPPELAHELVAMTVRSDKIEYRDEHADERRRIRERRLALVDAHPGVWLAFEEAARNVAKSEECDGARLDVLVAKWADPDAARLRLTSLVHCAQLLGPRTSVAGAGSEVFANFARETDGYFEGVIGLAALRVAVAKIDADPSFGADAAGELRAKRLRREIDEDQLSAAIAALPAVDSPLLPAILAHLSGSDRLDIAGAAATTGHPDLARRWRDLAGESSLLGNVRSDGFGNVLGGTVEQSAKYADEQRAESDEALRQRKELLAWMLAERQGDPFAILVTGGSQHDSPFEDEPWLSIAAAVAIREGYPMLAQSAWLPDAEYAADRREEALDQCYRCAPELIAAIEAAASARTTRDPTLVAIPAERDGDDRPADVLARIDRAIDGPPLPWHELPLPAEMRTPRKAPKDDDCTRCLSTPTKKDSPPSWGKRLPRGELVRWEGSGNRIVAITASQTLDPVGELSSGGYWVSVSEDAGKSFAPPLYTGLRVYAPYVVRTESKLPLLDGDTLQVEVAIRELDAEHVMLPPIRLPMKRQADDVFVRIALAELQRDADDDGVPDPIEAAMLLDPAVADTDGDGINDGADMLPNVPWQAAGNDERAAAMAVALAEIFGKEFGAIITSAAHVAGGEPASSGAIGVGSTASNQRGVVFLLGPTDALARMQLRRPVVVLSEAQVKRLRKVRGAFYPFRISGFALNRASDEGVVTWDAGFTGGAFRLHKRDGKWVAESTSSWITSAPPQRQKPRMLSAFWASGSLPHG